MVNWNNRSAEIPDGSHAFLSPSSYAWFNYDDDKLLKTYISKLASARGTYIHDLASRLIKTRTRLPDTKDTLNQFVNDSISFKMESERKLWYSKFCFGTADAIWADYEHLKIFDLKTGKTKASFMQLKIYAALFFLEYSPYKISNMKDIELRIYQDNNFRVEKPEIDDIVPVMDKIVHFSKLLEMLEDKYDEGFYDYLS